MLGQAFCEPKNVESNGVLAFAKNVLFRLHNDHPFEVQLSLILTLAIPEGFSLTEGLTKAGVWR